MKAFKSELHVSALSAVIHYISIKSKLLLVGEAQWVSNGCCVWDALCNTTP
jgi:hypothetical protein